MGSDDLITGNPAKAFLQGRLSRRSMLRGAGAFGGLAIATSLLAACGGDDDNTTKTSSTTTTGGTTPTTGGGTTAATATKATTGAATSTTASAQPTAAGGQATTVSVQPTLAVLSTSTTTSGAQPTAATGGTPKSGGTWTLVLAQEPDTLDAHKTGAYVSGVVYRYIGDTLIEKNPDDATIQPSLATKYEIAPDGLSTTFTIQDGIKFWDGTVCDATAIKANYDRALDPATKSAVTIGQMGPVDTIEAPDASTVVFKHKSSFSVFIDNMAHPVCSIISVAAATAAGDQFGRQPMATGPWKFVNWEAQNVMNLEVNPDYNWGPAFNHKGPPYIEKIVIRFFPEAATALTSFEAKEIDQVEIPQSDIDRIQQDSQYDTVEFYRPSATFMEFQVTKAPFDDIHLRKAFNYTIQKQPVIDAALEGHGRELYSVLPQSIWGYWDGIKDYAYKTDPDKAKQEFEAAGYTLQDGKMMKDGQQLSFTFTTIAGQAAQGPGSQVLQSQLKDAGIDMQIEQVDFSTVITRLKAGDYQVSYIGYSYASPDIVYIWFDSANIGQGLNLSHFNNPDLDALILDSRSAVDDAKRLQDYQDIQKLIVDNAIWVPLYENSTVYGLQKRIAGYKIHPDGHMHLIDAYITDL